MMARLRRCTSTCAYTALLALALVLFVLTCAVLILNTAPRVANATYTPHRHPDVESITDIVNGRWQDDVQGHP